jgi:sugar/nucleoside kinase (ribokinase family)
MILVCGEGVIDLFVDGPSGVGLATEAVPGGSPFNVATGIARLGSKLGFLSKVSEDFFGRYLVRKLAEAGVDTSFVVPTTLPTTLSVIVALPHGQPHYAFYGQGSADRSLVPAELPCSLPSEVSAIAIGSYTLVVDPVASASERLVAREAGSRVISIDPNLRVHVIGDVGGWRPRFERLLSKWTIAKASIEVYGRGVDVHDLGGAAAGCGPATRRIHTRRQWCNRFLRGDSARNARPQGRRHRYGWSRRHLPRGAARRLRRTATAAPGPDRPGVARGYCAGAAFRHRGLVDHLLAAGRGFADARRRRSDHRMEQYVTVRQVSPVDFTAFRVAEGLAERQPFPGLYGRDQGGRWRGADGKLSRPGGPREPPGARTLSLLFHGAGSSR